MNNIIKIGGCYKTNDGGWLIVNKKYSDNTYKCHICYVEEDCYDEDIIDLRKEKIEEICDISVCYVPKYHKRYGLYKVWDGANRNTEIIIQNIRGGVGEV